MNYIAKWAIFLAVGVFALQGSAYAKLIKGYVIQVDEADQFVDVRWTNPMTMKENKARVFSTRNTKYERINKLSDLKVDDPVTIDAKKHIKTKEWMAVRIKVPDTKSIKFKAGSILRGK